MSEPIRTRTVGDFIVDLYGPTDEDDRYCVVACLPGKKSGTLFGRAVSGPAYAWGDLTKKQARDAFDVACGALQLTTALIPSYDDLTDKLSLAAHCLSTQSARVTELQNELSSHDEHIKHLEAQRAELVSFVNDAPFTNTTPWYEMWNRIDDGEFGEVAA